MRRLKPIEVVRTFAETVRLEMDLRFEAASAQELAENFAGDPAFRVPAVDWQRTSEHVLTLERVSGARVDDPAGVRALGLDPAEVVKTAAEAFFTMVFRHGFFHADMHPGNLFVRGDGSIVALDFGIMGRIDAATQRNLGEMLLGFLSRDYRRVAEVHIRAGYVPAHKSVEAFAQAARTIAEPILGKPIAEISIARLLGQLFYITEAFEMQTQPQLLLLQKSMLLAEGVGRRLAPETNMWEMARPLIEDWFRERLGPEGADGRMVRETAAHPGTDPAYRCAHGCADRKSGAGWPAAASRHGARLARRHRRGCPLVARGCRGCWPRPCWRHWCSGGRKMLR